MQVTVVYCPAAAPAIELSLHLATGATAAQAVLDSGVAALAGSLPEPLLVGVWGKRVAPGHVLHDGDRVEIYRPLTVDPKEARRLRYRAQGDRGRIRRKAMRPENLK